MWAATAADTGTAGWGCARGVRFRFNAMTVWMPIASRPLILPDSRPSTETFAAAARLAPGTDPARATAAVQVNAQRVTAALEQLQLVEIEEAERDSAVQYQEVV